MNTTKQNKYKATLFITEAGKFLLGGVKQHSSIAFDTRTDAEAWLKQAVETNQSCQPDLRIHGRINETH